MRSCWHREGLKSSNECPYGRQKRRKYTQTQMMSPREDGSRSWGDAAPGPGAPGAPRIRKRQELPREPSEGAGPCPHLNFRLQASRTGRGYVSEAFNLLVCGHSLRQPQDTHTRVMHRNLHFGCGAGCVQVRAGVGNRGLQNRPCRVTRRATGLHHSAGQMGSRCPGLQIPSLGRSRVCPQHAV